VNFSLTPEQVQLKESIARFAQAELNGDLVRRDREQQFNRAGWQRCADMGIQGLLVPTRHGGRSLDPVSAVAALEGFGYGCMDNGLCFAVNAHLWACAHPILTFGTELQRESLLPGLCNGKYIGAFAASEPEAGSDAYSLRTTAERRGDGYALSGHKIYVTNGPVADLFVVLATVDPAKAAHGVTAFLVEKGAPGLTCSAAVEKMGLRSAQMGELRLDNCIVHADRRLGGEGAGLALFNDSMEWERGFILASAVGAMQRQLEQCQRRAKTRRQFGKTIGSFQLVSNKLVDMQMRLATSRLLLYRLAWLKASGRRAIMEAAMTKLHISEAWVQSSEDALQIHGAHGYLAESGVERDLRDALASRIYSGTSEIQRQVIAQMTGVV